MKPELEAALALEHALAIRDMNHVRDARAKMNELYPGKAADYEALHIIAAEARRVMASSAAYEQERAKLFEQIDILADALRAIAKDAEETLENTGSATGKIKLMP